MSNTSLSFEPDSDLVFNDDSATLYIRNTTSQKVACKIEAKEADCYQINPTYFFLLSSIETVVKINFSQDADDDDRNNHEFSVSWLVVPEENVVDKAETYWKKNLKARRKEIVNRTFGCEVQKQSPPVKPVKTIVPTENRGGQKLALEENIGQFGKISVNSHLMVVELNAEFATLIETIESQNSNDLKEIIRNLRIIAADYKHLEHETRSTVRQTNNVLNEVIKAIESTKLNPSDKIQIIKQDFSGLTNHFDRLAKRHSYISQRLSEQADKAEAAKEINDARIKEGKELRKHAKVCGVLAVPGVGLVTSIGTLAYDASESVENPALKVVAGVGGALGGALVGAVVTVGSPILLVVAAALAVKSKVWSGKFESMHGKIRDLEGIMNMAGQHLTDIVSDLNKLHDDTQNLNEKENSNIVEHAFDRIKQSCLAVRESCTKYIEFADSNTRNLKRIGGNKLN